MRATTHSRAYVLGAWFLAAVTVAGGALGCSSSNGNGGDGGGGASGHGGQGGSGGGQGGNDGGGGDGSAAFVAFAPCTSESAYVSNATEIAFGGTLGLVYSPACLKIAAGTQVTFSGDFGTHPLAPSTTRGMPSNNPIVVTGSGTTMSFTFDAPGFYGYFCGEHGTDQGSGMAGMIWVE
jgi:plastocyanin